MGSESLRPVVRHLRRAVGPLCDGGLTDAQLVERWVGRRDEAVFEVLVWRHGPMVLGVCRRVLRHHQDAEDAFQATFLAFVRKAASIGRRKALGAWLYKVAYRVALQARARAAKRAAVHELAAGTPAVVVPLGGAWSDLGPVLDEELNRLPEKYRLPFVLCYLEGETTDEVARRLGWPRGTVATRLAWARERLRVRLTRRGVTPTGVLPAAGLSQEALSAEVPAALVRSTTRTALPFAAGKAAGAVSARVAVLADGALRAMSLTRLRAAAALLFLVSLLAAGAGVAAHHFWPGEQAEPSPEEGPGPADREADQSKEAGQKQQARTDLYGDPLPAGALARLGTVRFRHFGAFDVTFSPDGKTLISAGADRTIRFWDVATGKQEVRRFPVPVEEWRGAMLSPDGKVLAGLIDPGKAGGPRPQKAVITISLWETATGKELGTFSVGGPKLPTLALSRGGRMLAVVEREQVRLGDEEEQIRLWNIATGKEVLLLRQPKVEEVVFSPDDKLLAVSGVTGTSWWEVATGKKLGTVLASGSLAFTADGKTLFTEAGWGYASPVGDGPALPEMEEMKLWDVATGKERATLVCPVRGRAILSPDGRAVAVVKGHGIFLWDLAVSKEGLRELNPQLPSSIMDLSSSGLTFSPDGRALAALMKEGVILLWDVRTGKLLGPPRGHDSEADSLAFSADGKGLVSTAWPDDKVRLWDATTGKPLHSLRAHDGDLLHGLSSDGKVAVFVRSQADDTFRLREVATGRDLGLYRFKAPKQRSDDRYNFHAEVTADGKTLLCQAELSGSRDADRTLVKAWDIATGKELLQPQERLRAAFASPDGKTLVSRRRNSNPGAWGDEMIFRDVATGRPLLVLSQAEIPRGKAWRQAFSPDGKMLAEFDSGSSRDVTSGGKLPEGPSFIRLWELATGKEVLTIKSDLIKTGYVTGVAFSPDGRFLALAGYGAVQLWDVATGKEVFRRERHEVFPGTHYRQGFTSLAFSPDGRKLATALSDTTILVWDLAPVIERAARPAKELSAKELDRLWADLAGDDAKKAHAALWAWVAAPEQAVAFLKDRLKPAVKDDARIRRRIADLDSDDFAVREAASEELEGMGSLAEPALRKAFDGQPTLETRRRLEQLLEKLKAPSAEHLRDLRAVRVLECLGTPRARQLLEALAKGAEEARITQEANASLERLARRGGVAR